MGSGVIACILKRHYLLDHCEAIGTISNTTVAAAAARGEGEEV